jgi:hypothetical protein
VDESPILIDVWTVEAEQQDELVRAIESTLRRLVVDRPGFVSADIYQSANRDMVLLTVRMQGARDRQALTDDPKLQQAYRELRRTATSHRHVYRLVESLRARRHGPKK